MSTSKQRSQSFKFRGRSFLAFVLKPEEPISRWLGEVHGWCTRSPGFFSGKPVVLDVSGLPLTKEKLSELITELGGRGIRVMGMFGADPAWVDPELPPLLSPGRSSDDEGAAPAPPKPESQAAQQPVRTSSSLVIDTPVRSGQSIFHDGDVTIIGSVSSGAEIVATGSIHVYGTLRGRVLAGADGNPHARIFCRKLEAELLAIDGYYRMADELASQLLDRSVHAWLEDGVLNIEPL